MLIDFIRTGGFAGIRLTTSVDTTKLPPDQATTLHNLIDEAAFFSLPEKIASAKPAPDRFEYRLTVNSAQKSHSIEVNDAAAPESLRPLLNYLTTMAMVSKNS
jgi:hypothetical protein